MLIVLSVVGGFLLYHAVLVWTLRRRRRATPPATRVVIQDPCNLIEEGSALWWLLGCFWGNLAP